MVLNTATKYFFLVLRLPIILGWKIGELLDYWRKKEKRKTEKEVEVCNREWYQVRGRK